MSELLADEKESLDSKVKAEWCTALRSGTFTQGQGLLYDSEDNTYCCLGVLQKLTGIPKSGPGDEYLDVEKAKEIGIDYACQSSLAEMNDDGYSFDDIAKHIEDNL